MAIEKKITPQPLGLSEEQLATLRQRPSVEEIARRQRVMSETLALRRRIGPVKITLAELLSHRYEEGDD